MDHRSEESPSVTSMKKGGVQRDKRANMGDGRDGGRMRGKDRVEPPLVPDRCRGDVGRDAWIGRPQSRDVVLEGLIRLDPVALDGFEGSTAGLLAAVLADGTSPMSQQVGYSKGEGRFF